MLTELIENDEDYTEDECLDALAEGMMAAVEMFFNIEDKDEYKKALVAKLKDKLSEEKASALE